MWCPKCQQDVPAISAAGEVACCARCGQALRDESRAEGLSDMAARGLDLSDSWTASNGGVNDRVLSSGDWLLDDEMQTLKRRAGKAAMAGPHFSPLAPDAPPFEIPQPRSSAADSLSDKRAGRKPSMIAWTFLSLGLMTFVCGGVLLGWSLVAGRNDLWQLGMPATLAGQFALLLGLVLQLDHLWQANRRTAETLDDVDQRLSEINHATTMLRTTHSAPAQSFYAHLAEGANPQLLLADLKGQLDILAVKMASQR